MNPDFSCFCVVPACSVRDTIACIDRNEKGIALVTDSGQRLLGTITDGDIRRAILSGISLDARADEVLVRKRGGSKPVTALLGADPAQLVKLMHEKSVRQVPLVDADNRVMGLATMEDLVPEPMLPLRAMIMAGGKGTRLRPFTEDVPKPMLMVGDRPLMEHIVDHLRDAGIKRVSVATQYLAKKITDHFEDGSRFGVELDYVNEGEPHGTAGALGLMDPWSEPLLVINGDVLTQVNFRAMLAFHRENSADMTVAVSKYEMDVPFGVVQCEGALVQKLAEKPTYSLLVNAGIYLLEPSVHRCIPQHQRFDMTDLINSLLAEGRRVVSFPILEYWLDVGKPGDYERAKNDIKNLEKR